MEPGTRTTVRPLACRPASSTALFTCALGVASAQSMPASDAPAMVRGGRPSMESMRAPMRARGSITWRIGRRQSDASPVMVVVNGWAATTPVSRRMVVPEFAASSAMEGRSRPPSPRPTMSTERPSCGPPSRSRTSTPRARRQASVAVASAPGANHVKRDRPSASEASSAYRCEIDLSPGGRTRPRTKRAGETSSAVSGDMGGTIALTAGAPGGSRRRVTPIMRLNACARVCYSHA